MHGVGSTKSAPCSLYRKVHFRLGFSETRMDGLGTENPHMTSPQQSDSEMFFVRKSAACVVLKRGDITRERADAVVNAANQRLLGGGGVDGAVHRAAGPELLKACEALPELEPGIRLRTGEALRMSGFKLPCTYLIQTVGPKYDKHSPAQSRVLLQKCYANSIRALEGTGAQSIAFPAISTGIYGYPVEAAAEASLAQVCESLKNLPDESPLKMASFILFSSSDLELWTQAARKAHDVLEPI
mmetsp:Transcript_12926/g.34842  ORF Transcript_12926/g.34842 Transcript_12926/m.34842 type:complete len:242 (-) Transcript_12926:448-1173(-)